MKHEKIITINIEGETEFDLEMALDEAIIGINAGNIYGFNSNEEGSFEFNVETKK